MPIINLEKSMDATVLNINNDNIIQKSVQKQNLLAKSEQLDKEVKPQSKIDSDNKLISDQNFENKSENFDQAIANTTLDANKEKIPTKQEKLEQPQVKESLKNTILIALPKVIYENNIKLVSTIDSEPISKSANLENKIKLVSNEDSETISKNAKSIVSKLDPEIYNGKMPRIETANNQANAADMRKILSSLQKYTDKDIKSVIDNLSSVVIKKEEPKIETLNNMPLPLQADKDLLISTFTRELNFNSKIAQTKKEFIPVENKNSDNKQNTDTPEQKLVPEDSKLVKEAKIVDSIRKIEELIYGTPITKQIEIPAATTESITTKETPPLTLNQKFNLSEISNVTNNLVSKLSENGNYTAILHLKPESLGSVMIEITLKNNMLNLSFKADSAEAARAIESQLANLSDKLSSNGIHTQSVEVSFGNDKDLTRNYSEQHQRTAKEDRETKEELLKSYRMLQNMTTEYTDDLIKPGNFLRMMKINQLYTN